MTTQTLIHQANTLQSLEKTLIKVQAYAGTLFACFVLLHLSNMLLAPFGIEVFNEYQRALRTVYQHPVVELGVIIGPLLTHIVAGVWLLILRRNRERTRTLRSKLHLYAGLFLLFVIAGHVLATRGASFFYGVFPEFEGLAFSMWFAPWVFYPYYFLLAVAGFYHGTNGLMMVLARSGVSISRKAQAIATGVFACLIGLSLAAFGGALFEIPDPASSEFARLGAELFGLTYE